jgi:hypothetical protein
VGGPPPYLNHQRVVQAGTDLAVTAANDANQKRQGQFKKESGSQCYSANLRLYN